MSPYDIQTFPPSYLPIGNIKSSSPSYYTVLEINAKFLLHHVTKEI